MLLGMSVVLHPDQQRFPVGTMVRAYVVSQPPSAIAPVGKPGGAVAAEAAVAGDGSLTLGLSAGNHYLLWAAVAGVDQYLSVYAPSAKERGELEGGEGIAVEGNKISASDPTTALGNVTGAVVLDFAAASRWSLTFTGPTVLKPTNLPVDRERGLLDTLQDVTGAHGWSIEGVSWAGGTPPIPLTSGVRVPVALWVVKSQLFAALAGAVA